VELKVDAKFIAGLADDRLKQSICYEILNLADGYGARTVAEGVDPGGLFGRAGDGL
jgi:EAL domain-containing protein (putative c-di-GMP-specific phosphodiesterase class I)